MPYCELTGLKTQAQCPAPKPPDCATTLLFKTSLTARFAHRRRLSLQLGTGQWLRGGQNFIIGSSAGEGKTWLACVLDQNAC